jgi:hypothetical protein
MAITRTDRNVTRNREGQIVSDETIVVDITEQVVSLDLHAKARAALDANQAYLALASPTNAQNLAQIRRLTRECSALIRLLVGADLLVENTDT